MAKKNAIQLSKNRVVEFKAFLRQGTVAPYVVEFLWQQDPWIWFGKNNFFPEHVRELVDNCGPLERSCTMMAHFIAGNGIKFLTKDGTEIPAAAKKLEEWLSDTTEEEFFWQTCYDLAHGLGMNWNARRAAGGALVRLDHQDVCGLRAGKLVNGRSEQFYWSQNWPLFYQFRTDERYMPTEFQAFDFSGARKDAISTIYRKIYKPRQPYYAMPWFLGGMTAAEVWTLVDSYNRTQINTGFAPAFLLGTRFDGTESERDKHEEAMEDTFGGASGKGWLQFIMGPDELEPFFKELARGNHAGELDAIRKGSADVVYDTYGIPSILMRDLESGRFTSVSDVISTRLQQFQRTLVNPLQKLITSTLTRLMNLEGIEVYEAKIEDLQLFDPMQVKEVLMASMTVDEAREQRGEDPAVDQEWGKTPLAKVAAVAPTDPNASPDGNPDTGTGSPSKSGTPEKKMPAK